MRKNKKEILLDRLNKFIKKYYFNQLIKGGIYVMSILLIFFLLFSVIEHLSSLAVTGRTILFWLYITLNLFVLSRLIIVPLLSLFKVGATLNYKDAAKIIGKHFPEVDDKLVNILELSELSVSENKLITASTMMSKNKINSLLVVNTTNDFVGVVQMYDLGV